MMQLTSPAFADNAVLPRRYRADGERLSPPLEIRSVPPAARSLVLVVDNRDSGRPHEAHWLAWNIPCSVQEIPEGSPPRGATLGENDFGSRGWVAPAPPFRGERYQFRLYALDRYLDLQPFSRLRDVEAAVHGHTLSQSLLCGIVA